MNFTVEKTHPTVTLVQMQPSGLEWEQWVLLRSDAHHDNMYCNRELEKEHLDEAKARDAMIIDIGDLFCAMQGKWDKRADQDQLRNEYQGNNYLDKLVNEASQFYAPYAPNWALLTPGNHETSIIRHHHTNLTERLAERLRSLGSQVQIATYRGWVIFAFEWHTTHRQSIVAHYTHGYGGGGPVTRDTIQANRQMVYTEADILFSGHTHDAWNVPIRRQRLNGSRKPVTTDVEVIKCGGYKDEFTPGEGFGAERGHNPKPIGAYWLRFRFSKRPVDGHRRIVFDVIRAKDE